MYVVVCGTVQGESGCTARMESLPYLEPIILASMWKTKQPFLWTNGELCLTGGKWVERFFLRDRNLTLKNLAGHEDRTISDC